MKKPTGHIETLPSGRHRARRGKETLGTFDTRHAALVALNPNTLVHCPDLQAILAGRNLGDELAFYARNAWATCFDEAYMHGTRGYIYAAVGNVSKLVLYKFGFSRNPERRIKELRRGPFAVQLIRAIPGTTATEAAIHAELCEDRAYGEWYHPTLAVLLAVLAIEDATWEKVGDAA